MDSCSTWAGWGKHVLAELERLNNNYERTNKLVTNHVQHTEHRLTKLESFQKNLKWILGFMITLLASIFTLALTNFLNHI